MNLKSPKMLFWIFIGAAVAIPGVVSALFIIKGEPAPFAISLTLATATVSFGSIPLFMLGLRGFTHELRRACRLLYLGIVLYAIGQLQFPLFTIIHAPLWTDSGAVILPFFLAIGFIFFGMRRFGKLMGLKLVWMSRIWVPLAAIISAALVAVLIKSDRVGLMTFEMFLSVVLFAAAMIAVEVRRIVAVRYRTFLTYLVTSFGMLVVAAFNDIVLTLWVSPDNWYSRDFSTTPTLLAALFFLLAGYAFCRINVETENKQAVEASPVDVIMYLADLASNVREIDVQLDGLRRITAQMAPNAKLTEGQEASLATIYKQLETYLIEKEPLRSFSKDELRERVRVHFQFDPHSKSPFWKGLSE